MRYRELTLVLLASVLAIGMWCYVLRVLIPRQVVEAARTGSPRGNLSDLYPRWLGAREWLLHGRDPYAPEVTRDIQTGYWGRPLDPRNPSDPKDEARFAYPAYVVFLLAPTVWLPFPAVQVLFAAVLALGTAVSVLLWGKALRISLARSQIAGAIVLTLGSWPAVQGLLLQQLSLLAAVLLAASAAALVRRQFVISGLLLALATIKPQLTAPMAAWLAVWISGSWRSRWRVGGSFLLSLGTLFAAAELALPGWFARWYDSLHAYVEYAEATPLLSTLFGDIVGGVLRVGVITLVALVCWRQRRQDANSPCFARTLLLTIVAGLLVMPRWASYDQVLLLPIALWIAHTWRGSGLQRICVLTAGWQWISALALSLIAIAWPALAQRLHVAPLIPTLALPLAGLCALAVEYRQCANCRTGLPLENGRHVCQEPLAETELKGA